MPSQKPRHVAALALLLAVGTMKLTACFLNATPPNPHETPDADPPADGGEGDAGDGSDGAP